MKKHLALFAIGAAFLLPQSAAAASLTQAQVVAIVALLQSFGADQSVIANVQKSLGGASLTVSNTCKSSLVVTADTDTVNLKVDKLQGPRQYRIHPRYNLLQVAHLKRGAHALRQEGSVPANRHQR